MSNSYIVAITGASGSIYGVRLIEALLSLNHKVYLTISRPAFTIINHEMGINWQAEDEQVIEETIRGYFSSMDIRYFSDNNLTAPISSGSFITDGMFIVPCSMKTLAGIANGYASNLIERSADVMLKECRRLIIAPREMPFNAVHLENMLKLARLGVRIVPPIPGFYHKPKDIDDIVNFVVGKILDSMEVKHDLFNRWG
ncbi:MAG: flavin prenyltransferase UbiX [Thermodesulfovibrionia bacterium]